MYMTKYLEKSLYMYFIKIQDLIVLTNMYLQNQNFRRFKKSTGLKHLLAYEVLNCI